MADNTNTPAGQEGTNGQTAPIEQSGNGGNDPKTFTQEQVNRMMQERIARVKAEPPADYEELKAKAARLDEIEEANKSELEKANDAASKAKAKADEWKAKYEEMRAHARDWENKAKANKGAADELEKLKAENLSEQEKAIARAEKAEAELQKLKANAERAEMYTRIASKTKLPLEVIQTLNGEDEDALVQQANALKKLLPDHPNREDDGGGKSSAKKTNADRFAAAFGL